MPLLNDGIHPFFFQNHDNCTSAAAISRYGNLLYRFKTLKISARVTTDNQIKIDYPGLYMLFFNSL